MICSFDLGHTPVEKIIIFDSEKRKKEWHTCTVS